MGFFDVPFLLERMCMCSAAGLEGTHRDLRSLSRVAQLSEEVQHRKLYHALLVARIARFDIPERRLLRPYLRPYSSASGSITLASEARSRSLADLKKKKEAAGQQSQGEKGMQ